MSSRLRSIQQSVSSSRMRGQDIELEKGDFPALVAAAWATLGKTALLTMLFFAAVMALLILLWTH